MEMKDATSANSPLLLQQLSQDVTKKTHLCLQHLLSHKFDQTSYPSQYPASKRAAVLVVLYEKGGLLRVLLTTRSKSLRAHPYQTALPGGKCDSTDVDLVATAVRIFRVNHVCLVQNSTVLLVTRSERGSGITSEKPTSSYTMSFTSIYIRTCSPGFKTKCSFHPSSCLNYSSPLS